MPPTDATVVPVRGPLPGRSEAVVAGTTRSISPAAGELLFWAAHLAFWMLVLAASIVIVQVFRPAITDPVPFVAVRVGLCFAALGLIITALAPSYDFFMYYFTLAITPMVLLCGVFFPVEQLPPGFQAFAQILPLTHAIALARPLMLGHVPGSILLHVAVLAAYAIVALAIALALFRRRLLK